MNNASPLVSVIMTVLNAEQYLEEAIESILKQTYSNIEFIIIDDASTDNSLTIIQKYSSDKRIKIFKNDFNLGLSLSLNKAIDLSNGDYIARMDADDISLPERLEKQVDFLENNKHIYICGTNFNIFKENDKTNIIQNVVHPKNDNEIKRDLLRYCALGHPTVMWRNNNKQAIIYNIDYETAQDYELWARLVPNLKFHNLQETLLLYRWHEYNSSVKKKEKQEKNTKKIQNLQIQRLGIEIQSEIHQFLDFLFNEKLIKLNKKEINKLVKNIRKVYEFNKKSNIYDQYFWKRTLQKKTIFLLRSRIKSYNISTLNQYLAFLMPDFDILPFKQKIIFIVKCLLHWKAPQ